VQAWYALWTRSRHECVVCRELEARGLELFLPTVPRWSVWKDRRKQIHWPLFPGYCFARFDPSAWLSVVNCNGVAGIVCFGGEPAPVPTQEIDGIRRLGESELQYDPCPFVREGTMVEVVRGPLAGLTGRLIRKGTNSHLVLSIQSVNQSVSVRLEASDVVPVRTDARSTESRFAV
jgi:transcription termination/antitermination protein NusG